MQLLVRGDSGTSKQRAARVVIEAAMETALRGVEWQAMGVVDGSCSSSARPLRRSDSRNVQSRAVTSPRNVR